MPLHVQSRSTIGTQNDDSAGSHMHAVVFESPYTLFGGRVLQDCIAQTAAVIGVGKVQDLFLQPHDVRVGYDELAMCST